MAERLAPLPAAFAATRDSLHALACYAIAPARKARTGRIGLRPTGDGFGTPAEPDGSRLAAVRGDRLLLGTGDGAAITTVRAAAERLGVTPSSDPGVGSDLPAFTPDADLAVEAGASLALGRWFRFGAGVLDALAARPPPGAAISEAQLWPEHFDLAVTATLAGGRAVNVGASPGDAYCAQPYLYVGPHDPTGLAGDHWNAPFGALLAYDALAASADPATAGLAFVARGLDLLAE